MTINGIPDLAELIGLRGTARTLTLHTRRPALAQLHGEHRSSLRGRGLEFEEVRLYAPGDDARNIDWRVTARRGKMHTKLFREERERPVWLVIDLHAGLFFGSRLQLKSTLLLRAAAVLAWIAAQEGDRIGAIINDGTKVRILQPRSREAGVLPILEALVESQPAAPGVPNTGGLYNAVATLRPLLHPGSLVFLLSDFSGLDETVEELLANTASRSECRLLWIVDALEATGLPNGVHCLGVPGHLRQLDGAQSRAAWLHAWNKREQQLNSLADKHRFPLCRLETSAPVGDSLTTFLRTPKWAV